MEYVLVGVIVVLVAALLWVVYDARAAAAEAHAHTLTVTAQAASERNELIRAIITTNAQEYALVTRTEGQRAQAENVAADAAEYLRRRPWLAEPRAGDPAFVNDDGESIIPVGFGG